jgi:hypothetical protein
MPSASSESTAATSDGVTKGKLKTGTDGRSQAQVMAKGANIPMPTPISGTEFFDQDAKVISQRVNDQTANRWQSELTTAQKNTAAQFKAKLP